MRPQFYITILQQALTSSWSWALLQCFGLIKKKFSPEGPHRVAELPFPVSFPGGALLPLLLRAANGIFTITTVSSAHLSRPGCTFSTSVTRATIRHLMSWCPIWLLSLINCWFNHTLQSCYIQIHNRNFCAYFWPSPVSWPPKRLFISSDPPVVVFVSVDHAHSEACRPPSLLSVRLPFSQWYFSCGVQLTTCIVMQTASLGITSIFI